MSPVLVTSIVGHVAPESVSESGGGRRQRNADHGAESEDGSGDEDPQAV